MCILLSKCPNINLMLLITKAVSAVVSLKICREINKFSQRSCFSSLNLKFPVICGLKKNRSMYQEQLLIVNTYKCV